MHRSHARRRQAFTLIEVLLATALLGFSLIVMFGFHAQAARSNLHARKITDCTYLAQAKMEELMALPWTEMNRPDELEDSVGEDPTTGADPWAWLEQPDDGGQPSGVNAAGNTDTTYGQANYYITWDIEDMDSDESWTRIRVRCVYEDHRFNTWRGTTISSYKYRDDL